MSETKEIWKQIKDLKNSNVAKVYGYCRCSTNETKQDIDRQVRELKQMGATDKTIYKEFITGSADVKIEQEKMFSVMQEGDTLVVTEVSRISRSTKQLCDIIDLVKEKKICLVIKDSMTVDCRNGRIDPMTKAFLQIAGVFGELEKNLNSERVKSGLKNAKEKGKTLGRPKTTRDEILVNEKFMNAYNLYRDKKIKKTDIAKLTDMSRVTVDKYIKILEDVQ